MVKNVIKLKYHKLKEGIPIMREFISQNSNMMISFVIACVTIFASFVVPLIKSNTKAKVLGQVTLKVFQTLPDLIQVAEKISGLSGDDKKRYVLNQIQMILNSKGVDVDLKQFDEEIDKLILLTKTVNTPKQVKPESKVIGNA